MTRFIIDNNDQCSYVHFHQGKSDKESANLPSRVYRIVKTYRLWKKHLKTTSTELVHYNFPLDARSIIRDFPFMRYTLKHHIPLVVHIHGGLYLFKKNRPFLINTILRRIFAWPCTFIVLSNKEKTAVEEQFHAGNVEVLPNCIDLKGASQFHRQSIVSSPLHLLYLGRIEPKKGMDFLLEACETLQKKGVDFVVHLAGKDQCDDYYLNQFRKRLGDRFRYEGIVAGDRKTTLLKRCQVFVLPSFYEGVPISLLETMSFGCVPVVTNVGSISEFVDENVNGLFVKQKDSDSIVDAIELLNNDRDRLFAMGCQARRTIFDKQDPQQYISQLNQIYHLCLDFPTKI